MEKAGIPTIDLVVVNLYPFSQTVARPDCTLEEAIENIDIGGPAMVRSAARTTRRRGCDRSGGLRAIIAGNASRPAAQSAPDSRFSWPKAFSHTAAYDGAISNYLTALEAKAASAAHFPQRLNLQFRDRAGFALRRKPASAGGFLSRSGRPRRQPCQLRAAAGQGAVVQQYRRCRCGVGMRQDLRRWPACVIVKHANPCGVAIGRRRRSTPISKRLRHRSHFGLRRHHRIQPRARRRGSRGGDASNSSKC